jgi:hypothetical protein
MFCRVKTGSGDDAKTYTGAEMVNELLTPLQTGRKEAVEAGTLANRLGWQAAHQTRGRYELGLPGKILGNDGGKPKVLMGPQEIEYLPLPLEGGQGTGAVDELSTRLHQTRRMGEHFLLQGHQPRQLPGGF